MKKLASFFIFLFLACCSNDDSVSENQYHLNQYNYVYMDYPDGIYPTIDPTNNLIRLEYDSNFKIKKRIGGISSLDQATGWSYIINDLIYDELSYSGNEILIKRKYNHPEFTVSKYERKLTLDGNNKILEKIIFTDLFMGNDTIKYEYNNIGQLSKTRLDRFGSTYELTDYYYNSNKNLDSIVNKKYYHEYLESKTVEIFSNYDNAENPLKNLIIFEETFNRALSKNNYKHYERYYYYFDNEPSFYYKNWTLLYDIQGKVIFDQ